MENQIYFHPVTGELLKENTTYIRTKGYEIDQDDFENFENKQLDNFLDVCQKDKVFFKLWNRFINNKR